MFRRWSPELLAALVVPTPTACGLASITRDRLLVWHDWPAAEAVVLTGLSGSYEELDPDLELIVEYVPPDDLESRVADEVKSGFGPDVLIGADAAELFDLVAAGAVHRITRSQAERYGYDEVDTRALAAMAVDETQRGVPLAASTDVLYYCDGVEPRRTTYRYAATREVSRTRRPRRRSCGIPNSHGSSSSPPGNVARTKC